MHNFLSYCLFFCAIQSSKIQFELQSEEKKQAAADVLFQYSKFVMACIGNQVRPCDLRLHLMKVFWRFLFKLLVGNSSSFISFGFICLLQKYVGISLGFSLVEECYEEFKHSSSDRSNRPVGLKALSDCYFLPSLVNFFFPFRRFPGCQLL